MVYTDFPTKQDLSSTASTPITFPLFNVERVMTLIWAILVPFLMNDFGWHNAIFVIFCVFVRVSLMTVVSVEIGDSFP